MTNPARATALAASQREAGKEIAAQLASNTPDRARLHALVDRQLDAVRASRTSRSTERSRRTTPSAPSSARR
jgi:hypothetical protein